jgi:hypothetical protein
MKRSRSFLLALALLGGTVAVGPVAVSHADYTSEDYAAGKALLVTLQEKAKTRQSVLKRPHVFIRSQTKYSGRMYQNTYFWHDRPLFASRMLWDEGALDYKQTSFARNLELYKSYGLDGFATFAWTGEYERTFKVLHETAAALKLDPKQFQFMLEAWPDPKALDIEPGTFDLMMQNPYSFRINGKTVISSYVVDNLTPAQITDAMKPLRERSGDKVLFLPMIYFIHLKDEAGNALGMEEVWELYRQHEGTIPASVLRPMQEYLRSYARTCDGLYLGPLRPKLDRTFDQEFSAKVLYPLFKSVLAEPEFNGKKILAASTEVGYTSYHAVQSLSRDGTKTLRRTFDLAAEFKPDVLIGAEWDELNEDTGFQPLVAKPMSTQRIIKYYTSRWKGQPPTPNPGDDLSLPNLIVSQRRQLLPGVTFQVELLNVPDTAQGQPYRVRLELLDENDKVLFSSVPQDFNTAQLKDKTFDFSSEQFKDARALRSRLTINHRGQRKVLAEGLPFTVMRATTEWDQTWYCTPVRNVLQLGPGSVTFDPRVQTIAPGATAVNVSAQIQAPEKLAIVEGVQDSKEIFAYDTQDEYLQADPNRRLVNLFWNYVGTPPQIYVSFTAKIEGAPSAMTFAHPIHTAKNGQPMPVYNQKAAASPAFTDNFLSWQQNQCYSAADYWKRGRLISLTTEDMAWAVLTVEGTRTDGPHKDEKFSWSIPLKELGEYGVISKVFDDGLMFAVQTQYRPSEMPLPIASSALNFKRRIVADDPNGVLALRAVSENGKVFWSKPFALNSPASGKMIPVQVYSSTAKKGVTIQMPESRVPNIKYDFTPRWGNILHTSAGRAFYGHAGGSFGTATDFWGLESLEFGTPFDMYSNNIFKGADKPAPTWTQIEDGKWALSFDGERGNFIALPNIAMPLRTGFTVSFEVKPRRVKAEHVLFANEAYSFGTVNLSVKDGKFQLYYTRRTPDRPELNSWSRQEFKTNIPLHADQWQKVVLTYDESRLTLSANGQTESFPFEGIGLYLQQSVFGGRGDRTPEGVIPFYDGLLRSLEIKHTGS